MQRVVLLVCFVAFANALTDADLWTDFKVKHAKSYETVGEEQRRFEIFQTALRRVEEHNARYKKGQETYFKAINHFSDLTQEEFKDAYLMKETPQIPVTSVFKASENIELPDFVNWTARGAVLPVRDQQMCGSCWAFSALAALEGQVAIKHNRRESLSTQELVDCTRPYGSFACRGGWPNSSYDYIMDNGISRDVSYPYLAQEGTCSNKTTKRANISVVGYRGIDNENEEALKEAVATIGPMSVLLVGDWIQEYGGGVFDYIKCIGSLNHAAVVVGYGTEKGLDYWILKNSWNIVWGEEGYIRMARNKMGQCGIASFPTYPIIK